MLLCALTCITNCCTIINSTVYQLIITVLLPLWHKLLQHCYTMTITSNDKNTVIMIRILQNYTTIILTLHTNTIRILYTIPINNSSIMIRTPHNTTYCANNTTIIYTYTNTIMILILYIYAVLILSTNTTCTDNQNTI